MSRLSELDNDATGAKLGEYLVANGAKTGTGAPRSASSPNATVDRFRALAVPGEPKKSTRKALAAFEFPTGNANGAVLSCTDDIAYRAHNGEPGIPVVHDEKRAEYVAGRPDRESRWDSAFEGSLRRIGLPLASFPNSDALKRDIKRRNRIAKAAREEARVEAQAAAPDGESAPGASWLPQDTRGALRAYLDGTVTRPLPTLAKLLGSELGLFYAGKVSGIHGESGAGKSWILWLAMMQELNAGNAVVLIDFEDSIVSAIERLVDLGTSPEAIETLFGYIHPEERSETGRVALAKLIADIGPTLVGIDSTGEGLSVDGVQPNADEEVAEWFRTVPRWIARQGPAVVILDHSPKSTGDGELFPIGSQRKRSAIDGAQYLVAQAVPFSREKSGHAVITCAKDRPGVYAKRQRVGKLDVVIADDRASFSLVAEAPKGATEDGDFRPTAFMEKASKLLEASLGALSQNVINKDIKGRRDYITTALNLLVAEGFVRRDTKGQSLLHTSLRPYRQIGDPLSDSFVARQAPLTATFPVTSTTETKE